MKKNIKWITIAIIVIVLLMLVNIHKRNKIIDIKQLTQATFFFVQDDEMIEIDMLPEELKALEKVINGHKESIVFKHRIKEEDRVFVLLTKDQNGRSYKYEFVVKGSMDMIINKWLQNPQEEDDYEHLGIWLLESKSVKTLLDMPLFKNYFAFAEPVKPIVFCGNEILEGCHQSENWQYKDYQNVWREDSIKTESIKATTIVKDPYINLLIPGTTTEEYYALYDAKGILIEEGNKIPLNLVLADDENTYTLRIENKYEFCKMPEDSSPTKKAMFTSYKGTTISEYKIHYAPDKEVNQKPSDGVEVVSIREVLEALKIPYGIDNESDVIVVDTTTLSDEGVMTPERKVKKGTGQGYTLKIGNRKASRIGYKEGDDYLVYLDQIIYDLDLEIIRDNNGEWIKRNETPLLVRNIEREGDNCMLDSKKITAKVNGYMKYAMLDDKGHLLSDLDYDFMTPFCQGYAIVGTYGKDDSIEEAYYVDDNLNYLLQENGQPLQPRIKPESDLKRYLIHNGIALAYIDDKYNYIDAGGNLLSKCEFEYAEPFINGRGTVYCSDAHADGKEVYINSFGERIKLES